MNESVQEHVAQLNSLTIRKDSQGYLAPSAQQQFGFRDLADGLRDARSITDLEQLLPEATAFGYDVVVLSDRGETYFGLQESATVATQKGWGSFFLRQDASNHALVEVVC